MNKYKIYKKNWITHLVSRGIMSNTGHCDISVTIARIKKKYIQDLFSIIFLLIRDIFYFNICIYISNIDHYIKKKISNENVLNNYLFIHHFR